MPARFLPFARRTGPPDAGDAPARAADVGDGVFQPGPPRPPHAGALRRERRALLRRRELDIRDLGGLLLEMARRDRFRQDLLLDRCSDVLLIEERINELDSLLVASVAAAAAPGGPRAAATCRCGAPLARGAHFCSHCGRPAAETPPVVTCPHCGQPLPAEINFCAFCGNPVPEELDERPDATMVRPPGEH